VPDMDTEGTHHHSLDMDRTLDIAAECQADTVRSCTAKIRD